MRQESGAPPVSQEAEVAKADQAFGQQDETGSVAGTHRGISHPLAPVLIVVSGVAPAKGDLVIDLGNESIIRRNVSWRWRCDGCGGLSSAMHVPEPPRTSADLRRRVWSGRASDKYRGEGMPPSTNLPQGSLDPPILRISASPSHP
jgi:hypothetical protein